MDDLTATVRTAFASGWATSPAEGPLTDHAWHACRAAIHTAFDAPDDPDITEATLKLGHLEGTWAAIYDRRDTLYTTQVTAVTRAWHAACADLPVAMMVRRFRRRADLAESVDALIHGAAVTAAAWLLHQLALDPTTTVYLALVGALAAALKKATAEGEADAIGLAAHDTATLGVDVGRAYGVVWRRLADVAIWLPAARRWLTRIITAAITDLGALLDAGAAAGDSEQDMAAAVTESLTRGEVRAVTTITDLALGQTISAGMLAFYAREQLSHVNFVTAGDGTVCPVCQDAEDGNPYLLANAPQPGLHPHCRCSLTATTAPVGLDFSPYL